MLRSTFLTVAILSLAGCPGKSGDDTASGDDTGSADGVCTEPTEVDCIDEIISDLSLQDDKVNEDDVSTETDGDDFVSYVDASAGGYGNETRHAWQYLKFTDTGLEDVNINDEDALESMDWDIAARRFILRLNGGSSGPSCVGAATMGEGYTYENLEEAPDGITYATDDFYSDDCTMINDSSGLEGSPQTVLAPWWNYESCVETSDQPFLIQLADGRVLKFVVEAYYEGAGQDECNQDGSTMEAGGYFQWRWRFL
jgi:hypothetical protein